MTGCIDHGRKGPRYTTAWHNGRQIGAHVKALILRTGEEAMGRYALHTCGNDRCINGEHLYWGDQRRNLRDAVEAGTLNPQQGLTQEVVADILATHIPRHPEFGGAALSRRYGLCPQSVNRIIRKGGYSVKKT